MIFLRPFTVALLVTLLAGPAHSSSVAELKTEREKIEADIAAAITQNAGLDGGLLKTLVSARIELLKLNSALLQQRIHAIESGAKITMVVTATQPDADRVQRIDIDLRDAEAKIAAQRAESAKLSGGLLKVMQEATIATTQLSLETLRIEYLKAKHGIAWMPSQGEPQSQIKQTASAPPAAVPSSPSTWATEVDRRSKAVLVPTLSNKRFRASDYKSGTYRDAILFDVVWDTSHLKQPVRAIKGVMVFADLFGEIKFRLRYTINKRLKPGERFRESQVGFEYNQFRESEQWVRGTDLEDMKIQFIVSEVIYQDGSVDKLEKRDPG